jgi:uncharacterized membrane protein
MTKPPPRNRFQFHLSTAIVMMFVAGALIWANCSERIHNSHFHDSKNFIDVDLRIFERGWPITADTWILDRTDSNDFSGQLNVDKWNIRITKYIIIDVLIAITTVFIVCFLCEWLIRRRAARKGA